VLSGDIVKRVPVPLDQAQSPCLLPDGRGVLFAALKEGVQDIWHMDILTGEVKNLTNDAYADSNPQVSPDGKLVAYTRRISGNEKIYLFPLDDPARKTQVTFGAYDDTAPSFAPDGNSIYYSSTEDDDIYNVRSLDLRTGVIRQYTDALGGNTAPEALHARNGSRVGFITYFKGEFRLQSIEVADPIKEVEQEATVASSEEIIDFQPDLAHQVVAENKRKKRVFEKLFLEGRPPLNVGVTSGGDFFGGSQIALADVLADKNFIVTAVSLREFRSYDFTYFDLGQRLHWGVSGFDNTQYFYASPYNLQPGFSRQGAFATTRVTGGSFIAQYPLDKFRRIEVSTGAFRLEQRFENPVADLAAQAAAEQAGTDYFLYNGTVAPISVSLIAETTHFREFGPLSGHTYSLGVTYAPGVNGLLGRQTFEADARKYIRLGGSGVLAGRVRGFHSTGDNPDIFYFGGNMELRGYPYLSLVGNTGFFANLELRLPIIDVMKTPIGILGPVRGTIYGGIGGAKLQGQQFQFGTSDPGVSYVSYPGDLICSVTPLPQCFGEPVNGYHLVDGRASYGVGLQFFFLGYPMHFDWSKLTDLKVTSDKWRFDFWIGFDF
jgi:WD40 repeat protein